MSCGSIVGWALLEGEDVFWRECNLGSSMVESPGAGL